MAETGKADGSAAGDAKALQAHVAASFGTGPAPHALPRDGLSPLTFTGSLLAEVSSWNPGSRLWYELAAYERDDGGYVAVINVFRKDVDSRDSRWARAFRNMDDVLAYFEKHDPSGDVAPGTDQPARRSSEVEDILGAAALRQRLSEARAEYEAAAGELLEALA
jgi:hypothetical protein